jgi:carbon-monoxide dehydrogenase medium subunit
MYKHSTDAGWISRTHRAIQPFRLQKPETVADTLRVLSQNGGDAGNTTIIAGGIDLIRRMREGDRWDTVVDISGLTELRGISDTDNVVRIGALTTHWELENSTILAGRLPQLQSAWKTIGNVRIRMRGSIGGNLMAGEAGYDGWVLLAASGARPVFAGVNGEELVSSALGANDEPAGGLLIAVEIPVAGAKRIGFDRSLKPVVSVAVGLNGDTANVAVGCAYHTPYLWTGPIADINTPFVDALPNPRNDAMGSAAYRRRMIGVLARRLADVLLAEEAV